MVGGALKTDVERVSCEHQSDTVSDLLGKLKRFRHAVVTVFSALWRGFAFSRVLARCLSFSFLSFE